VLSEIPECYHIFTEKRNQNRRNRVLHHNEDRLIPLKEATNAWTCFSAQLWVSKFEILHDLEKGVFVWTAGSHTNNNSANTDANSRSDFEQLQPNGMTLSLGELCSVQPRGSQFIHQKWITWALKQADRLDPLATFSYCTKKDRRNDRSSYHNSPTPEMEFDLAWPRLITRSDYFECSTVWWAERPRW